jgi:hypothetical protein
MNVWVWHSSTGRVLDSNSRGNEVYEKLEIYSLQKNTQYFVWSQLLMPKFQKFLDSIIDLATSGGVILIPDPMGSDFNPIIQLPSTF